MNLPLQMLLDADLREAQKSRKPRGDYWYASELGACPRKAFYSRSQIKPDREFDARTLRVFRIGSLFESFALDNVVNKIGYDIGDKKIRKAEREVVANDDILQVHGRADLVVEYDDNSKEVVECKSIQSKGFTYLDNEGKAKEYHEFQLWWYLYKLNVEKGQFIYLSKDDLRVAQFPLTLSNQMVGDKVMNKLKYLNSYWADKKTPPRQEKEGGLCSPKWCEYYEYCHKNK
jgi:hypothetical protein